MSVPGRSAGMSWHDPGVQLGRILTHKRCRQEDSGPRARAHRGGGLLKPEKQIPQQLEAAAECRNVYFFFFRSSPAITPSLM